MNKFIRFAQNYLIVGLPFVIACMLWETLNPDIASGGVTSTMAKVVWQVLGINIMLWFAVLIVFLISLVTIPSIREKTLRRLANLKERDEREQYITGKAARAAYISSLSLMILFLFFSLFTVNIARDSNAEAGHRLQASIGLHFSMFNEAETSKTVGVTTLFDSKEFTLSSSTMIFILIGWQLLVFNITARREQDKDNN